MTCDEAEVLLHALIDGELDAGHAREVEAHVADCAKCAALAKDFREMRAAIAEAGPRYRAPLELRRRIENSLPRRRGAEPPRDTEGICHGLGGVCDRGKRPVCRRPAQRRRDARAVRDRLGASALAAGRPPHRRGLDRPAYGQALVQRPDRCRPAGDRPHRPGLYPDRRPARLYRRAARRRGGVSPPPACHQSVRGADREHGASRSARPIPCRVSTSAAGANAA